MKTKYFEYNRNGGSEKYSEFTEEEYLKAKEDENRWFISFGDSVLECEESQYTDHFSKKDHDEYTQKDKTGRKLYLSRWSSIHTAEIPSRKFSRTVRLFRLRNVYWSS